MKIKLTYIFILFAAVLYAQSEIKYEITNIEFNGNSAISSSDLKTIIYSKESPGLFLQLLNKFSSMGGKPIYFDSLLIPMDIGAIKGLYQSKGYFKAKVSAKYILNKEDEEAQIVFNIQESEPAYLKSLVVKGLEKVAPEHQQIIFDYDKIDTNAVYQDAIVEDKKNYTLTFLKDHGYMFAKEEKPNVVVDTVKNRVNVELKFNIGKRFQIGEIYTTRTGPGFDLIDDATLKEIVAIEPGSWYSYYEIQRAQVRLYRTNLFTSAGVYSVYADTSGYSVPLQINADIGVMHELSPEIIMNNEDNTFNLGLGLNFVKKNFFGEARKFTAGISATAQNVSDFIQKPTFADSAFYGYLDARISIEQPYLFGKPITTKSEIYLTSQKRRSDYNSTILGGKLTFDFEMPQFTYFNSLNAYLNIEKTEYTYKRNYLVNLMSNALQIQDFDKKTADSLAVEIFDNVLSKKLVSSSTNATIGINVGANKTDNLFFPTEGYTLSMLIEDANSIPFLFSRLFNSSFDRPLFLKTVFTSSLYLPFFSSKKDAFGLKFKIGQIFTYRGDKANISLNQRLYSGGSNSVRGWSTRQLVPSTEEFNLTENLNQEDLEAILLKGAATGGFFLMEGSIEARLRLLGQIGTAFFIDYGNTWNDYHEFRFDEVAVAAGFGFRYYSEFVPFRIDFGVKLYDPNDRRNFFKKSFWSELLQFHIGIAEAF